MGAVAPSAVLGGGGTKGEGIIAVNLTTMEIETDDWTFSIRNKVLVKTYDINGNLTDVDSISINITDNLTYSSTTLKRESKGIWSRSFIMPYQNISEISLNAIAIQKNKIINKTIQVPIKRFEIIEKTKEILQKGANKFDLFLVRAYKFITTSRIVYFVAVILVVVNTFWFVLYIKKKRRRNK